MGFFLCFITRPTIEHKHCVAIVFPRNCSIRVIYKANSGFARFGGEGWIRPVYFSILIAHVIGAIAITPLVPWTLLRAIKGNFEAHRRLARWTLPLWVYVGVSGVVVYVMAVHIYPYGAASGLG